MSQTPEEPSLKILSIFMECKGQLEKPSQLSVFYPHDVGHRKSKNISGRSRKYVFC